MQSAWKTKVCLEAVQEQPFDGRGTCFIFLKKKYFQALYFLLLFSLSRIRFYKPKETGLFAYKFIESQYRAEAHILRAYLNQ